VNDYISMIGQVYFNFSLCNIKETKFSNKKIRAYGLMIALYIKNSFDKWTIVTSEWTDISIDGSFHFQNVEHCNYSSQNE